MKPKKIITGSIKFFITFFLLYWFIQKFGWKKIVETVSHTHLEWLIGGSVLFLISIILGSLQWQVILRNKELDLPFRTCFKLYFMGIFFSNFMFGMIAGDAFKVTKLHFNKNDIKAAFAATMLDRLAGLIALSFFAIIGGSIIFTLNIQQNKQFFMVMGALTIFLGIFFGFFIIILSQRLQNILRIILHKLPNFPFKEIVQNTMEVVFIDRHGKEDKTMLAKVAVLSLCIQSLRIGVNIFCAQSLGMATLHVLHYFCVIIPAISLLMIVPNPLGVRETIGGILFDFAGFSLEGSVIMLSLATIVNVTTSLLGGIFFLSEKNTHDLTM